MASIIDCVKNFSGDKFPYIKVCIVSLVIYFIPQLCASPIITFLTKQIILVLMAIYLLGFISRITHNGIIENNSLIPSLFNPFITLWDGFKAVFALAPVSAFIYFVLMKIYSFLQFEPIVNNIILFLSAIALIGFFFLTLVLYSKRLNIIDVFKIGDFIHFAGDFIASSFVALLFIGLFILVIFVPLGAVIYSLFGQGPLFNFFAIFAAVYTAMLAAQYYTQIYLDILHLDAAA